uniref:Copia protein n=1 Tax=Tanacetum cinerariifolium TaxID=118510 RepID=A0A6L2M7M8_TANCI|nr:copia protein [Tanacetum cinerariifolium]
MARRKFLRALPTKLHPKVTAIEESKDLSTLPLDELIGNLKFYEVALEKDLEISKNKKEKYKSLTFKIRKFLSEEKVTTSDSNDEEYAMASDSEDDSKKEEICLMALDNNEILSDTPYYSSSSLDNESCLLYLTVSRSDIMFSVCLCVYFQEAPKTSHLEVVKRIFRYIKGTSHLGLWYPKGMGVETIFYANFNHAGDYVDRKNTSGVCTFMRCFLTSWFSKKQTALAISTTEAKYVFARKACQQALCMKQALVEYDINLDDIPVLCDNKGAIDLSKNPVLHSRTKHIEIRHHFLRDNVQKVNISIEKVSSEDNIADIRTKPLKHESFNLLRLGLGLTEANA